MTREEAISTLRNVAWLGTDKKVGQVEEALQMALTALQTDGDCISRQAAIRIASGYCHPANVAQELAKLPSVQPEVIRCKDCRYYKEVTSIHGDCESADMWSSLFGEVAEVEAIEVHKDHYCGYAERRTDERDKT